MAHPRLSPARLSHARPSPSRPSLLRRTPVRSLLCASFLTLPLLTGCAVNSAVTSPAPTPALVTGNWQFSSSGVAAARLPAISGELSGSSSTLSGILHAQSASACVAPGAVFEVSGAAQAGGAVTLSGPLAGGTLTITGTLAADGKSLTGASYTVAGGTCAFAQVVPATAQSYTPINGTYAGTFSDANGPVIAISAQLQQSDLSNTSGNYTLTGTGTFPSNGCFTSPVAVSNTQVTGGSFTMTYTDAGGTGNQVTASGTFSPDATTLTITSWQLTGPCGPDVGVQSTMTKQ